MGETPSDEEATATESERYFVSLDDSATNDDVDFGVSYYATVNDTAEYGVFVRLAGRYPDDVGGLVHKNNLPDGTDVEDFVDGDRFAVQLRERQKNGDLSFEVLKILDGAKGTTGVEGSVLREHSPVPSEDDAIGELPARTAESRANNGETATTEDDTLDEVLSRTAIETISGRLDTIEDHLDQNTATVRARVIDAGDGTTLLRVPGETVEEEHGDLVELSIQDVGSHDE